MAGLGLIPVIPQALFLPRLSVTKAVTLGYLGVLLKRSRAHVLASLLTLALDVTEPLLAGAYGRAAFDAVGPLLLIGWAEIGPGLLQVISGIRAAAHDAQTMPRGNSGSTQE
ncbi:hypothetical protein [Streptomyces sp. NPDC058683]|uniref:hypothetical protein n=1 Tax=Streptomyces sp. NPDC058683 TaxID=3346597 RepID=UPI003652B3CC